MDIFWYFAKEAFIQTLRSAWIFEFFNFRVFTKKKSFSFKFSQTADIEFSHSFGHNQAQLSKWIRMLINRRRRQITHKQVPDCRARRVCSQVVDWINAGRHHLNFKQFAAARFRLNFDTFIEVRHMCQAPHAATQWPAQKKACAQSKVANFFRAFLYPLIVDEHWLKWLNADATGRCAALFTVMRHTGDFT